MQFFTPCPVCNRRISLWQIMMAAMPWSIPCPHCKTETQLVPRIILQILVLYVVVNILIVVGNLLIFQNIMTAGIAIVIQLVIFAILLEVVAGLMVCNSPDVLIPVEPKSLLVSDQPEMDKFDKR